MQDGDEDGDEDGEEEEEKVALTCPTAAGGRRRSIVMVPNGICQSTSYVSSYGMVLIITNVNSNHSQDAFRPRYLLERVKDALRRPLPYR
jgi:hypothetical protein